MISQIKRLIANIQAFTLNTRFSKKLSKEEKFVFALFVPVHFISLPILYWAGPKGWFYVVPAGLLLYLGPMFTILYFVMKRWKLGKNYLGLTFRRFGYAILVVIIIKSLSFLHLGYLDRSWTGWAINRIILYSLFQFVFIGFVEEFYYRGYVQSTLCRIFGVHFGVLVASTYFAIHHIPQRLILRGMTFNQMLETMPSLFIGGILEGYLFIMFRCLFANTFMHAIGNIMDKLFR